MHFYLESAQANFVGLAATLAKDIQTEDFRSPAL